MTSRNDETELLKEMQRGSQLAENSRIAAAVSHIPYVEASDAYYGARNKAIRAANGIPHIAPTAARLQEIYEFAFHVKGVGVC